MKPKSIVRAEISRAVRAIRDVLRSTRIGQWEPVYRFYRQLIPLLKDASRPVEVLGHIMFLDAGDNLNLSVTGHHERLITELIQQLIQPGDIVVDVGAHIGYYTLQFARATGVSGHVYAFEPDPVNYRLLAQNVAINGYERIVTLEQMAVSDRPGELILYRSPNTGDHRIYDSGDNRVESVVRVTSIDAYFGGVSKIDFIKMDIQGAEGLALRGSGMTLSTHKGIRLVTEFWPFGLSNAGTDPDEYIQSLEQLGFHLHLIDNLGERVNTVGASELSRMYDKSQDIWSADLYCDRAASTLSILGNHLLVGAA